MKNVEKIYKSGYRYVLNISFKKFTDNTGFSKVENIAEPLKTLKEAEQYKSIVDNTVERACIIDRVTGKVAEWWVK